MDTRNFRDILTQMQKTLECSICLELLNNPVTTKCDHQFCSFCITKFLQSKRSVPCPLCKKPVTKRGIQERSELSLVINNVKQLIQAYETDTKEKFTPSKTYREVLPASRDDLAYSRKAGDRRIKNSTQTTSCQKMDICHGESESTSVPVCGSGELHPLLTACDSAVPRTRSRRSKVVWPDVHTVVDVPSDQSSNRQQSNGDLADVNGHRRLGRKRKLSFESRTSDNYDISIVKQKEKLSDNLVQNDMHQPTYCDTDNDNLVQHDMHQPTYCDTDNECTVSNTDILCYLEEGSCGAVHTIIPANRNENCEHVISISEREDNTSKKEPGGSNQKCDTLENIQWVGRKRKPCKYMNNNVNNCNKKSILKSSKTKLLPCISDSSSPVTNSLSLSADTSKKLVADKTCHESKDNEALKHNSELDLLLPLHSNDKTVKDVCRAVSPSSDVSSVSSTQQLLKDVCRAVSPSSDVSSVSSTQQLLKDVCRAVSPSSDVSSVSSTQQLLKPKPVTTRTYTRGMRKSFHDGFVKNWADTLPEKDKSSSLNQPKGLTTKEKIYAKKQNQQSGHQPTKLQENVTNHLKQPENFPEFEPALAQVPNRKSIFKSRIQNTGNKNCALDIALSSEMINVEDPFEFKVGHTPVKPKRKISSQRSGQQTDKTKEDVSGSKTQNKKKTKLALVQSIPLECVSVSTQVPLLGGSKFSLSSAEVEKINKTPDICAEVAKTSDKHKPASYVHLKNLANSSTKKNKTVHFTDDLIDVDLDMQPTQANDFRNESMSITELNIISAEANSTVALDNQKHQQDERVTLNNAQEQTSATAVSFPHSISKATDTVVQHTEYSKYPDKDVAMNIDRDTLVNECTGFQDMSVDVTLTEEPQKYIHKQNKTLQSPEGDSSCLLQDSRKVNASVQKRKLARRRKKQTCPDTETFSQKAGKELTKLIHKINEAEEYDLMFNTQDVQKRLQDDLQKEQELEEAFGFNSQDSDACRQDKIESKTANSSTETEHDHKVIQEMVAQSDHIEHINTQENPIGSNVKQTTNSLMDVLEKANTAVKSKDLKAASTEDRLVSISINGANVVANTDIYADQDSVCHAVYQVEGRINSTLLEPVEVGNSHINQDSHISLHTKHHIATTPVETRARSFPKPNFSKMVQVSPCAKGVLTPTNPTLISSSAAELHSSHMDGVSDKTITANIATCEQSQQNQEESCSDPNVNSKIQSPLTSNTTEGNKVKEGQDSSDLHGMSMCSHIPGSNNKIPKPSYHNSTISSTDSNKDLDGKFSVDIKTRIRKTSGAAQLSLKSKNTSSEAASEPPDMDSKRIANDAIDCSIILAPDTCIYSSNCRTSRVGSKYADDDGDVILETLDLDTNIQHTNYVHSDHIVLSPHSPSNLNEVDQNVMLTTTITTNRTREEATTGSQIWYSNSTQGLSISLQQNSEPKDNMNNEYSSSYWIGTKKTAMAFPDTAALINLRSSRKMNNNVTQSAAIVVTSQETSSGCSALSQSILLPTGAHKDDLSDLDNNCSRLQKHSLDKNVVTSRDNQSKPLCLTVPETPNSRVLPNNQVSSAPCRITCSESEDEDYVLIVRRKKQKCFSLDGSPLKPVVFGSDQKLLEGKMSPVTKNDDDECSVDMIGETEFMRAIDTWAERDVDDDSGTKISGIVSGPLQHQQEGDMCLTELRATEENVSSTGQACNKMSPELVEIPPGKLRCIDSSGICVAGLKSVNFTPFSKAKSHKQLLSPTSEACLTKCETNKQPGINSSDLRKPMTVITLTDVDNEVNKPNKLSENVEISVPETNVMSQSNDDTFDNNGNNSVEDLLINTGLDISQSENAAETSVTGSRTCEPEKGKQTKRGLAKKGCLHLDASVKHPRGLLSPTSKAAVRSMVERPADQEIVTESDSDVVINVDTEEGDFVDDIGQNRIEADAMPGISEMCDSDLEMVDPGNVSRKQRKVKKLTVGAEVKKSQVKETENKYYNEKKQLETELFGLDTRMELNNREEKGRKQEIPIDHTKHACTRDVDKVTHRSCVGNVDKDDELVFDLGDSSDDETEPVYDARVKNNAKSEKSEGQKSEVIDQFADSVNISDSLPITSSPVEAGSSLEHANIDQSVIGAVDETDVDDEDSMCMRPKSRVKRLQIISDSDDSSEAIQVRSPTNCTSSSALSSQSEILNTEQQEALETDVAKLHQQIAEYEAKLDQQSADLRLTAATQERDSTKISSDAGCDRNTPTIADEDEDSNDLFVSPLSPSPPPRQSSIKPVPKRPAHSKPSRQTDQYIKQFQSPGGTVRTKKSLEFTVNTVSSHNEDNAVSKANSLLGARPVGLHQENNVVKKQSSDRVLLDTTNINIVSTDAVTVDEVMGMNDPSEDKLILSPVILSQKSRQIISQSEKRDLISSVASRRLEYPLEKDVCLAASALGREEYLLVMKLAERYGFKFTSKFSTEVTHVVMKPATGYDRVCDRTLKFFQGVAYKCWVVAFPWVLDSLQAGSLLPEEDYEIVGDTSGGENTLGVQHSRLSRKHLFSGFCVACVGDSSEMPKKSLHELLTVCGATVVDDPMGLLSKVANYKMIVRCSDSNIAPTTAELDMFNGFYKHGQLPTVMREWVLDSLGSYKLQPLNEYVLNTGVSINITF